jgi:acylphosphatase
VFAGPQAAVEAMIDTCRRGPSSARVSELTQPEGVEADLLAIAEDDAFSVLPTI